MLGIDTNVILRFYERDDPEQAEWARSAIERHAPVLINEMVLIEFVWVCQSHFKLDRQSICRRLQAIIDAPEFEFTSRGAVERAVAGFGSRNSDFSDWLIGEWNSALGCSATLTFDKGAAKTDLYTLVP